MKSLQINKDSSNVKKIKVLRVISRLSIGGPSIHVKLLTKGLDPKRFTTKLVTGHISPQEGDMSYLFGNGDALIVIPELQREINLIKDLRAIYAMFRILRMEKPHIVHSHTAKAGFSARFAVWFHNLLGRHSVQMVHTFHGHVFEGYFEPVKARLFLAIERFLGHLTHTVIAISKGQKAELARKYKVAPLDKICIIPLGFDLSPFFNCHQRKGELKALLDIPQKTIIIGIIGRLVPIKNHHLLLRVAALFLHRNPNTIVKFLIVGDGELRQDLESACLAAGLSKYVKFCGWIRDVPMVYADLDILALTSLNEGTPVSIIESMAASVPVITTDVGGIRDLLGPLQYKLPTNNVQIHKYGVLCAKNDVQGLVDGLEYLLNSDPAERKARARRSQLFVAEKFHYRRLIRDMESLYSHLMRNKPSS